MCQKVDDFNWPQPFSSENFGFMTMSFISRYSLALSTMLTHHTVLRGMFFVTASYQWFFYILDAILLKSLLVLFSWQVIFSIFDRMKYMLLHQRSPYSQYI